MKKIIALMFIGAATTSYADPSGIFVGGGIGYGMQSSSYNGASNTASSPAMRIHAGYQFADWIGAEVGWNYVTQGGNWNGLGSPSSTIYDLSFTPGFTLPATPVTIFTRLGINSVSTNLNNSWYNQLFSSSSANFEFGAGVKVTIPGTNTFVRAEYINYGGAVNNGNSNMVTTPSSILIDAGYIF